MLPLTFADPANYDHIGEDDRIAVLGPASLESGKTVTFEVTSPSGGGLEFSGQPHLFRAADRMVQGRLRAERDSP